MEQSDDNFLINNDSILNRKRVEDDLKHYFEEETVEEIFGLEELNKNNDVKPTPEMEWVETDDYTSQSPDHKGLRYNTGKTRLDLIPAFVRDMAGRVLTKGADKYEDRNWERGMAWSNPIASLERHLNAFKGGEDYDPETGELHIAHALVNAMFLTQYYKTYPQGDDRPHKYLEMPKIGLDIDEVLCNWLGAWMQLNDISDTPTSWDFSYAIENQIEELKMTGDFEKFYLTLPPLLKPIDLPFEPHCYITSRSIDTEITEKWLQNNGFPTKPVHTVGYAQSKVGVARESGIDIFVDDCFKNFKELNEAGICTFLWDRPHNQKYDVGYKRITSLSQIFDPMENDLLTLKH